MSTSSVSATSPASAAGASQARGCPSSTVSPTSASIRTTRPETFDVAGCCIFIASSTTTLRPAEIRSPSCASIMATCPRRGARIAIAPSGPVASTTFDIVSAVFTMTGRSAFAAAASLVAFVSMKRVVASPAATAGSAISAPSRPRLLSTPSMRN